MLVIFMWEPPYNQPLGVVVVVPAGGMGCCLGLTAGSPQGR